MGKKELEQRRLSKKRRQAQRVWLFLALGGVILMATAFLLLRGNTNSQPLANIEIHGAPALRVDKEKVDLGDVKLGQTVQVSFQVTNVGDKPLQFSAQPYVEVVEGC
jgi:hypothetical protein